MPMVKNCRRVVLILFATVLFLTVIPVSAGGDYIAAGCLIKKTRQRGFITR